MAPSDPRHGTTRGYDAERRTGGPYCDPCRRAAAAYEKKRRLDKMQGRARKVSPVGSVRRIRALMRLGWTTDHIAKAAGLKSDGSLSDLHKQQWVTAMTAVRISRAYDQLSMKRGPSRQTAGYAERHGWLPPLMWDDALIDDPAYLPRMARERPRLRLEVDEAVVLRVLSGERLDTTPAERSEVVRRWLASGRSEAELCRIQGWREGRYTEREEEAS